MATAGLTFRKLADHESGSRVAMLRVLAAEAVQDDVAIVFDAGQAERILVNPDTPGYDHEPWPLAGVEIVGKPPKTCRIPTQVASRAQAEGWAALEGEHVAHAPGGPDSDPWRVTHTFVELDAITFHTVDGDVRYKVTHQPGKYDDADEASGKRVDWFYDLKLEEAT